MKKRMFLTTVLMTLVLLVAVTTATFAWYQATLNNSTATSTLGTAKNDASGVSMTSAVEFIAINNGSSGAVDGVKNETKTGETVTSTAWSLPESLASYGFLPVSNNQSTDADVAALSQEQGNTATNLGFGKFKSYVQQTAPVQTGEPIYDFYVDNATAGIAAMHWTLTVAGNASNTDQEYAIRFELTNKSGSVTNACWVIETSEDSYLAHAGDASAQYVAVGFNAKTTKTVEVWIWLNGCATTNAMSISNFQFNFSIVPFVEGYALPTTTAATLTVDTYE